MKNEELRMKKLLKKTLKLILPIVLGGTGYCFNNEGNQVSYRCDVKRVTTIHFDRNKIRGMAAALSKRADEISMSLDKCLVNTEVSYEPPFDMNDSFEDILSDFIEKSTAA